MSKALLWVCKFQEDATKDCIKSLSAQHYQVEIVQSLAVAKTVLRENRFGTIALCNDAPELDFVAILDEIFLLKEVLSSRLVLIQKRRLSDLESLKLAALGVRDFIPLHLPIKLWIKRFLFAVGNRDAVYIDAPPVGGCSVSWMCKFEAPACITWINEEWLRMESHLIPSPKSRLLVQGGIAQALGQKNFTVQVETLEFDHLDHRFSVGIVARHELSKKASPGAWDQFLKGRLSQTPRHRVMLAVGNLKLREFLFKELPSQTYVVHSVIRSLNLSKDPLYFSPDFIICDAQVALNKKNSEFENLLKNLPKDLPIVMASKQDDMLLLQEKYPTRAFFWWDPLTKPQFESLPIIKKNFTKGFFLKDDHKIGLCYIEFPGRINMLHPLHLQVSVPFPMRIFALLKIASPQLKIDHDLWFKVTKQEPAPTHHLLEGYIANLHQDEILDVSRLIGKTIIAECRKSLENYFTPQSLLEKFNDEAHTNSLLSTPSPALPLMTMTGEQEASNHINFQNAAENFSQDKTSELFSLNFEKQKTSHYFDDLSAIFISQTFKYFVVFVLFSLAIFTLLVLVMPKIAENYQKSGGVFVDQLKQFSHPPTTEP